MKVELSTTIPTVGITTWSLGVTIDSATIDFGRDQSANNFGNTTPDGALARISMDGLGTPGAYSLALDPEQPETRYNLATILYQQGEIEQAASELRRVVAQSPWFADAHYNLGTALECLGGKRQAAEHLGRYVDLAGSEPGGAGPWLVEARARLRRLGA